MLFGPRQQGLKSKPSENCLGENAAMSFTYHSLTTVEC